MKKVNCENCKNYYIKSECFDEELVPVCKAYNTQIISGENHECPQFKEVSDEYNSNR